jgi:3-oxoacyl-[acyl-carrier-protein] synthase II
LKGRRVVVTGIGVTTPVGNDLASVSRALRSDRHGIRIKPEWGTIRDFDTRLAAEVVDLDLGRYPRKKVRTMGRVALLATYATEQAVAAAAIDEATLQSGAVGIAYGSTHGSSSEFEEWCRTIFKNGGMTGLPSTSYLKFMSNTCAANLALFYGIRGRVISTCAACVSASQAIGAGFEMIRSGTVDAMICGGAEELHFTHAGVFGIMFATSRGYNDRPGESPRPFDARRDGLVVGEGAGTLVLESYDRARSRGAPVVAEVLGYGTNCDGTHVTSPSSTGMAAAMRLALASAELPAERIEYVNAHATATEIGDIAESHAMFDVFGDRTPVSSTKGFMGHTLGACGAIEAALCIAMMREGWLAPNRNLDEVDPRCAPLDYVRGAPRDTRTSVTMTNNFAFGGINTSLILGLP